MEPTPGRRAAWRRLMPGVGLKMETSNHIPFVIQTIGTGLTAIVSLIAVVTSIRLAKQRNHPGYLALALLWACLGILSLIGNPVFNMIAFLKAADRNAATLYTDMKRQSIIGMTPHHIVSTFGSPATIQAGSNDDVWYFYNPSPWWMYRSTMVSVRFITNHVSGFGIED